MRRLRDTDDRDGRAQVRVHVDNSDDPLFQAGVDLLRGTPPTPPAPETMKDRVWRSFGRAAAPASAGLRTLVFKLAVVGAIALVGGTAGAMIAQRWIMPKLEAAPPAAAKATAPRVEKPAPAAALVVEADERDDADEIPPPKPPARSAPKKPASPLPSAAAVARERTEVLDALIALRRQHDPVHAGTLLARYLTAHPRGALREEALVLAIEAADARGDRAAGEQLAHAYQAEFPAGRFLIFARSHTVHGRTDEPRGGAAGTAH